MGPWPRHFKTTDEHTLLANMDYYIDYYVDYNIDYTIGYYRPYKKSGYDLETLDWDLALWAGSWAGDFCKRGLRQGLYPKGPKNPPKHLRS